MAPLCESPLMQTLRHCLHSFCVCVCVLGRCCGGLRQTKSLARTSAGNDRTRGLFGAQSAASAEHNADQPFHPPQAINNNNNGLSGYIDGVRGGG